jgi:hypothetical protein
MMADASCSQSKTLLPLLNNHPPRRKAITVALPVGVTEKFENGLHWTLDVTFNEDACRVRSRPTSCWSEV